MAISKTKQADVNTYRRITPKTVATYKVEEALQGNGSSAVRKMESTRLSPASRAFRIRKKSEEQNSVDFIDDTMQQIGVDAINRIGKMINSSDEKVATRNSHYIVDHIRGQSVRRSESKHLALTIEAVLD